MRKTLLTLLLSFLLVPMLVRADTLTLKDGSRVEGDVKRTSDGYTITTKDGKTQTVRASDVASIQPGSSDKNSAASSADRLGSLRRSVESITDVRQIIDRYKRFIDQNKGTPAAKDAEQDLAMWQDRLDRNLVKVGGKWVTQEEKA